MAKKTGLPVSIELLEKSMITDLRDVTQALVKAEPVAGSANIIRCKNRRFTLGEQPIEAPLTVIVLATAAGQFYYEGPYDPEVKSSPVCFALATSEAELVPDPASPKKQNDGPCLTCKQNQPGSGDRGGFSRACALRRRLAVMFIGDKSEDPQWASIELSVTAIRGWSTYVKGLAGVHNIPYFLAVTQLDFEDDKSGDFWHLGVKFMGKVSSVRPDWLTPPKGTKVGQAGWFDTTLLGRKVKEINETRALLVAPVQMAEDSTRSRGGKKRVPVGQVKTKGKGKVKKTAGRRG